MKRPGETMRDGLPAGPRGAGCWKTFPAWSTGPTRPMARRRTWSTPACSGWFKTSTSCRCRWTAWACSSRRTAAPRCRSQPVPAERTRSPRQDHGDGHHARLQVPLPLLPHPRLQPVHLPLAAARSGWSRRSQGWPSHGASTSFFGTDDNFFNNRETAEEIFSAMARGKVAATSRSATRLPSAPRPPSSTSSRTRTCCPWPAMAACGPLVRHRRHDGRAGQEGPEPRRRPRPCSSCSETRALPRCR